VENILTFLLSLCIIFSPITYSKFAYAEESNLIAAASGEKSCLSTIGKYTDKLKQKGYTVKTLTEGDGIAVIKLESISKSSEKYGLLGVSWDEKEVLEMKYIVNENTPKLISVSGEKQHKAPLLGKWETVAEINAVSPDLVWKSTDSAGGQ